jgi:hypothetical protein
MQIQLPYDHTQQIPLLSQDIGERVIVPQHQKKNWKNTSVLCSKFSVIFKNDMICDIGLCHWAILTVNNCCLTPIDQIFRQEEVTF